MRRLTGAVFLTLDGVMQAPGGPTEDPTGGFDHGGWLFGFGDPEVDEAIGEVFAAPYALLLGRFTYDIFAAYWPYVTGEEQEFAASLNRADKYVLTRDEAALEWENSTRLVDIDAVAALKASDGPDLLIQGSGTLYPPLLRAGLLDRLITFTFPIVLGTGKRLFGDGTPPGTLAMTDHRVTQKGTVIATYEPAGGVAIGSAPPPPDNPREPVRQEKMRHL